MFDSTRRTFLQPKKSDPMYRVENAIAVEDRTINGKNFQTGVFDIVMERETATN